MKSKIPKSLRQLPFLHSEAVLIKQWCRAAGFLYFSDANHLPAGAGLVRGATLMPGVVDQHICVGEFKGRDATLLHREVTLSRFEKQPITYIWHIVQMECSTYRLPRMVADKAGRNDALYQELTALNWPMIRWDDPHVPALKRLQDHHTLIFCRGGLQHELEDILNEDLVTRMLSILRVASIEWEQERLILASPARSWQQQHVTSLLNYADTLANELEYTGA